MKIIVILFGVLTSYVFAGLVAFNSIAVTLNSDGLKVGDTAPQFTAVTIDFEEVIVGGAQDKIQVIAFLPSIDTSTCELETTKFNTLAGKMEDVLVNVVSKDLPFAQKRFCSAKGINNVRTVSDYKDANNALRYGATISAPVFLEGLFGRVIYIVDTQGKIAYVQVVDEISMEPDYKKAMDALDTIRRDLRQKKIVDKLKK